MISSYFGLSGSSSPAPAPSSSPRPQPQSQPHSRSHNGAHNNRRAVLQATCAETLAALPRILTRLPSLSPTTSELTHLNTLPPLRTADCPRHPSTRVRVVNGDSFTVAIEVATRHSTPGKAPGEEASARPAVLNLASATSPGGGWRRGTSAQEEALCYRSSLALSLDDRHYPFRQLSGVYSPDVVVIREEMGKGHALYTCPEAEMPVVSVVSVAAVKWPRVRTISHAGGTREVFASDRDRLLTKGKMRVALRLAAARGHGLLVLGALGCGAYANPREEVVECWKEVLGEAEFGGGWWVEVVFAVLDTKGEGNFALFDRELGGLEA